MLGEGGSVILKVSARHILAKYATTAWFLSFTKILWFMTQFFPPYGLREWGQIIENTSEGTSQEKCIIIKGKKYIFELGFSPPYKHSSFSTSTDSVVETALLFLPNTQELTGEIFN